MSVAVKKLEGVESVNVSLEKGLAEIRLKSGNRLTVERVRQVVRDNGFTPRAAEVVVTGTVIERGGKLAMAVSGLDLFYLLVDHPEAKGSVAELASAMGKGITVNGRVPERGKRASEESKTIEVRSFILEHSSGR